MIYRGHVTNGRITLNRAVPLPEPADVRVHVLNL
jgi:hypothetical protein